MKVNVWGKIGHATISKRAGAAIFLSDKIGSKQKPLPEAGKIFYKDKGPLGRQNNNKYIYTSQWKPKLHKARSERTEGRNREFNNSCRLQYLTINSR